MSMLDAWPEHCSYGRKSTMGLVHRQGKHTGRPPGSKSTPSWVRAARWARDNLNNTGAVPPSALAGHLLSLGREHPGRLVVCLTRLEAVEQKLDRRSPKPRQAHPKSASRRAGWFASDSRSRRLMKITVSESLLFASLKAEPEIWFHDLPQDAHVVGCVMDNSKRAIQLFLHSESFPELAEGEPIPELDRELIGSW